MDYDLQRRRKLPAWSSNPASPCTTVDVPSIGRRKAVRYPLVRAPRTTLCPSRLGHASATATQVADVGKSRLRIPATVLLSAAGVWSFSKPWHPQGGQASGQSGMRPGRVTLGKGGKVFPVGSCLAPRGATTRPAEACSGRGGGHTEVPEAPWASDAATSGGPTAAACLGLWHMVGLSQALLSAGVLLAIRGDGGEANKKQTNIYIYIYI